MVAALLGGIRENGFASAGAGEEGITSGLGVTRGGSGVVAAVGTPSSVDLEVAVG